MASGRVTPDELKLIMEIAPEAFVDESVYRNTLNTLRMGSNVSDAQLSQPFNVGSLSSFEQAKIAEALIG